MMLLLTSMLLLGVLIDGIAESFKALPVSWLDRLAAILTLVEESGAWLGDLLDAYMIVIPKAEGNRTPLGQRPLSVLPIVYRLWANVRLTHLQDWCDSWLPDSLFSAGEGRSSIDAWYSTSLDSVESISGVVENEVHLFVADVVKSFDTSNRNILDCVLLTVVSLLLWDCLVSFVMFILNIMLVYGSCSNWQLDWGILGPVMVSSREVAP